MDQHAERAPDSSSSKDAEKTKRRTSVFIESFDEDDSAAQQFTISDAAAEEDANEIEDPSADEYDQEETVHTALGHQEEAAEQEEGQEEPRSAFSSSSSEDEIDRTNGQRATEDDTGENGQDEDETDLSGLQNLLGALRVKLNQAEDESADAGPTSETLPRPPSNMVEGDVYYPEGYYFPYLISTDVREALGEGKWGARPSRWRSEHDMHAFRHSYSESARQRGSMVLYRSRLSEVHSTPAPVRTETGDALNPAAAAFTPVADAGTSCGPRSVWEEEADEWERYDAESQKKDAADEGSEIETVRSNVIESQERSRPSADAPNGKGKEPVFVPPRGTRTAERQSRPQTSDSPTKDSHKETLEKVWLDLGHKLSQADSKEVMKFHRDVFNTTRADRSRADILRWHAWNECRLNLAGASDFERATAYWQQRNSYTDQNRDLSARNNESERKLEECGYEISMLKEKTDRQSQELDKARTGVNAWEKAYESVYPLAMEEVRRRERGSADAGTQTSRRDGPESELTIRLREIINSLRQELGALRQENSSLEAETQANEARVRRYEDRQRRHAVLSAQRDQVQRRMEEEIRRLRADGVVVTGPRSVPAESLEAVGSLRPSYFPESTRHLPRFEQERIARWQAREAEWKANPESKRERAEALKNIKKQCGKLFVPELKTQLDALIRADDEKTEDEHEHEQEDEAAKKPVDRFEKPEDDAGDSA